MEGGIEGDFFFASSPTPIPAVAQIASVQQRIGALPPNMAMSLSELEERARQRAEQEAKWDKWQTDMRDAFQRLNKLRDPGLLLKGWQQFLETYAADNPSSSDDERMRDEARQRLAKLQQSQASNVVITSPIAPPINLPRPASPQPQLAPVTQPIVEPRPGSSLPHPATNANEPATQGTENKNQEKASFLSAPLMF